MWKSRYDCLRPSVDTVLDRLSKYVNVLEPAREEKRDSWSELTEEQVDSEVLRFAQNGDRISAIKLLRLRRGYTITEAKQFVDELLPHSTKAEATIVNSD